MSFRPLRAAMTMVSLLVMFGAGCAVQPRVVRSPQPVSPQVATQPTVTGTGDVAVAQVATVAYLRVSGGGQVMVTRGDTTVEASDATELLDGDSIEVRQGTATLIYPDSGLSQLETGTRVALVAREDRGDGTSVAAQLELQAGRVWTRFERVFGDGEEFSVQANGVVATVRGTAFGVSLEADGSTDIQVADHTVDVSLLADEEAAVSGQAGDQPPMFKRQRLMSGQALRIAAREGFERARTAVRTLTVAERRAKGFVFGATRLSTVALRRPSAPVRLQAQPDRTRLQQRREFLRKREELRLRFAAFRAPLEAPKVQVETKTQLFLNGKPL